MNNNCITNSNDCDTEGDDSDDDIHEPVVSTDIDIFQCTCGNQYKHSESLYNHIDPNKRLVWPNFECSCGNIYKHYRTLDKHLKSKSAGQHKFVGRTLSEDDGRTLSEDDGNRGRPKKSARLNSSNTSYNNNTRSSLLSMPLIEGNYL